jgi:hypothetical protein
MAIFVVLEGWIAGYLEASRLPSLYLYRPTSAFNRSVSLEKSNKAQERLPPSYDWRQHIKDYGYTTMKWVPADVEPGLTIWNCRTVFSQANGIAVEFRAERSHIAPDPCQTPPMHRNTIDPPPQRPVKCARCASNCHRIAPTRQSTMNQSPCPGKR